MASSWTFAAAAVAPWYWARNKERLNMGAKKAAAVVLKNSLPHQLAWPFSPR
jgi:hypothetical protein